MFLSKISFFLDIGGLYLRHNSTPSSSGGLGPTRSFFGTSAQQQQPQVDSNVLNDIEIEAQYLAASLDNLTENLCNLLHSVSVSGWLANFPPNLKISSKMFRWPVPSFNTGHSSSLRTMASDGMGEDDMIKENRFFSSSIQVLRWPKSNLQKARSGCSPQNL